MVNLTRVKQILRPRLEWHEGVRLKPYRDTRGKLTIGIGRNLDDKGISRDETDILLGNDIVEAIENVRSSLPWSERLDDVRFSVLAEMAFQMGASGLMGFHRFLAYLEAGQYDRASAEMLDSKWAGEDSPRRAERLARLILDG